MPWSSRWTAPIPATDLPTFVFGSQQSGSIGTRPLLLDADAPARYGLSRTAYRDWSKRLAAGLRGAGLAAGERVLLFAGNSVMFPVVFMGTIMAGGVFSGANPGYVARELAFQLKDTGARWLVAGEAGLETALAAADSVGFARERVLVFDGRATLDGVAGPVAGVRPWTDLLATEEQGEAFRWPVLTSEKDLKRLIVLNYSSGTTGVPKGVMICHRNYVANSVGVLNMWRLQPNSEQLRKVAKALAFVPMYHAYGQTYFCVTLPHYDIPAYIMPKFDFLRLLQHIQDYRVTELTLVPPVAVALAKRAESRRFDLSSIANVSCGAAPLGNEQSRELETLWTGGRVNVKQGWGMTEVTCSGTGWDPRKISRSRSIGELCANLEAKIMAEDEKTELGRNERGEFWVRGPTVMLGYWQRDDATKETLTIDGWLKTGDVAYRDEQDYMFIVDRKKELIKVKGNQVAPAELEALLMDMSEISDAAVIGVAIDGEEYPRAYLVAQPGRRVEEKAVHEFMNSRIARYKRLVGGVRVVESIPKNPSGKILRKVLRDEAKLEAEKSGAVRARL